MHMLHLPLMMMIPISIHNPTSWACSGAAQPILAAALKELAGSALLQMAATRTDRSHGQRLHFRAQPPSRCGAGLACR